MKKKPIPYWLILLVIIVLTGLFFIFQKNSSYMMENPYSSGSQKSNMMNPTTNPQELTPDKTSSDIDVTLKELDKTETNDTFGDLK